MKTKLLLTAAALFGMVGFGFSQFVEDTRNFIGGTSIPSIQNPGSRSVQNPTTCGKDTSYFANYTTTAYRGVSIRSGNSLGQYFGANQNVTISGFRFYAYALTTSPAKKYTIKLICNVYKAGVDSLPTGSPLASDTVEVDTVMGTNIFLSRITRDAVFKKALTLNYDYIITVESDSTNVSAGVITNSWLANPADGRKKNLGCGSVSGRWYRCLQLNIAGVTFDSDMQFYPFVTYKLGADFNILNDCYNFGDTVKFKNRHTNNVSSLPYYNFYINYNLGYFCQRWSYDGSAGQTYIVDGFYKPTVKKNFNVRLISVVYSYTAGQCYDTINKTVYFKPIRPTLKSPSYGCIGDTVSLAVSGDAGVTFKWYKDMSSSTPFFTGNSYTIMNVQKNDTFFVQAENGDCKSPHLRIDFMAAAYPNNPVVKNDSICQGAVANLNATSNLGKMEWFETSTSGTVLFTGTDIQTGKLFNDTQFFVRANNNGCINKGGRVEVKAFVNNSFAPAKPTVSADTFMCLRPSSALVLNASQSGSDTLRWFKVSSGGKPVGTGETYTFTPTARKTDVMYVETWNGVCGSGRTPINIEVYDYPTIFGLRGDTICGGDDAVPFLSVPWGTAHWYDNKGSSAPVASGKTPILSGLTKNTVFYVSSDENGCVSPNRDSVLIVVNTPPVPTSVMAPSVCAKSLGNMEVKVPYGKVNWYYNSSDPTPFYTGQKVDAGLLLSNLTYYYETEHNNCSSGKQPLTIVIKPRPTAGFTWALQWQHRLICTPITVAGLTLEWHWGDGAVTSGAPYIHQYSSEGNYTVRLIATSTANGCKDTADIEVKVNHVSTGIVEKQALVVYPVPVSAGNSIKLKGITNGISRVEIWSLEGKLLYKSATETADVQLPLSITPGIYLLKVKSAQGDLSTRLVVSD